MTTTAPYKQKDFPQKSPKTLKRTTKKTVRWAMDEPKGQERVDMHKKCPTCILVPPGPGQDKSDPSNYKFPICTKLSKTDGKCQYNCKGILAANRRARLTKKYPKVEALTEVLIEQWQCTKKAVEEKKKEARRRVTTTTKRKATPAKPKPKRPAKKPTTKKRVAKKPTTTKKRVAKKPTTTKKRVAKKSTTTKKRTAKKPTTTKRTAKK